MMSSLYEIDVSDIEGKRYSLNEYRGRVLLIVNTASECGFTPQYAGLQALYQKYHEKGLVVLGFPCDQFGHQEPGPEVEIKHFCEKNYGVTFPMHEKVYVNGDQAHPLFEFLKVKAPGLMGSKAIKWNFTKFLVDAEGQVKKRYASTTTPNDIESDIQALLN